MWRRTFDAWGYSPLDRSTAATSRKLELAWSIDLDAGAVAGRHADRARRRDVFPEPSDVHGRARRRHRKQALGAPPGAARGPGQVRAVPADESQPRDLRPAHHRQRRRRHDLRARCGNRQARVGEPDLRLSPVSREARLRAVRRRGQADLGPQLPAARRARRLRDHGARRAHGQGAVAQAHDPEARRARRRQLGQRAGRGPLARRRVDDAELRPRARSRLHRHVGHGAGAEVHAGRQRQAVPVPQLDARAASRDRRDGVVLPARRRSLGPRSSVRADPGRHGRRARQERGALDQPALEARRAAQSRDRHPRQDRPRLHARSRHGRIPLGAADDLRRTWSSGIDGATGKVTVNDKALFTARESDALHLPDDERRQELARRRVQPAHEDDVHAAAEHVHEHDVDRRPSRSPS